MNIADRIDNHQMHIKEKVRILSDAPDHRHTETDLRHENAVHDIDVNVLRARAFDGIQFASQMSEVRGQY